MKSTFLFCFALVLATSSGLYLEPSRPFDQELTPKFQEERKRADERELETVNVQFKMVLALSYFDLYSKVH